MHEPLMEGRSWGRLRGVRSVVLRVRQGGWHSGNVFSVARCKEL